jgi:transcriptional regulator with XRE-family HTH domain
MAVLMDDRGWCDCGCSEGVVRAGARFRPGHYSRTAKWKEQYASRRGRGEWRICPRCGDRSWVKPSQLQEWRACSRRCARALQTRFKPSNPLKVRCLGHMAEKRLSPTAFARQANISPSALRYWLRHENSTLSSRTLVGLAEILGISFEQALREAGGRTDEQRRAELGIDLANRNFPAVGSEADLEVRRKSGLARRGKRRPPDVVAKVMATRQATGKHALAVEALIRGSRSAKGRIAHHLFGHLRWTPKPSLPQLHEWAQLDGQKLGWPAKAVFAVWEPYLRRNGVIKAERGGRRFREERLLLMRRLMVEARWDGSGRAPWGFWPRFERRVRELEGDTAPDQYVLRQWWGDAKHRLLNASMETSAAEEA